MAGAANQMAHHGGADEPASTGQQHLHAEKSSFARYPELPGAACPARQPVLLRPTASYAPDMRYRTTAARTAAVMPQVSVSGEAPCAAEWDRCRVCRRWSVLQQQRQRGVVQHVLGDAAQDPLQQTAAPVSAQYQSVRRHLRRRTQQRRAIPLPSGGSHTCQVALANPPAAAAAPDGWSAISITVIRAECASHASPASNAERVFGVSRQPIARCLPKCPLHPAGTASTGCPPANSTASKASRSKCGACGPGKAMTTKAAALARVRTCSAGMPSASAQTDSGAVGCQAW